MGWYSSTYRKRKAITVINTAGGATKDVNIVIPVDWDEFWTAQTAAGDTTAIMIRVTNGDGYSLLAYSVDDGAGGAASISAKTVRIQVDGATLPGTATELGLFWVYYDPSTTVASAAVVTTIASALTGGIELAAPAGLVGLMSRVRPGFTRPQWIISKTTTDEDHVWMRMDHLLQDRGSPSANRMHFEEPWAAAVTAKDSAGSAYATLLDTTKLRWVEIANRGRRRLFLVGYLKAGVSGTNYTVIALITTAAPGPAIAARRVIDGRVGVRCLDTLESAT